MPLMQCTNLMAGSNSKLTMSYSQAHRVKRSGYCPRGNAIGKDSARSPYGWPGKLIRSKSNATEKHLAAPLADQGIRNPSMRFAALKGQKNNVSDPNGVPLLKPFVISSRLRRKSQ